MTKYLTAVLVFFYMISHRLHELFQHAVLKMKKKISYNLESSHIVGAKTETLALAQTYTCA